MFNSARNNSGLSKKLSRLDTNDNDETSARPFFNVKSEVNSDNDDDYDEGVDSDVSDSLADDLTLSILYQTNKLGCSFYDSNKKTLFYLNDLPETSVSNFELTNLILDDLKPNKLITSAKVETKFMHFLKKKCNIDDQLVESDIDTENEPNESDQESDNEIKVNDLKNIHKMKFFLTTSNDYDYETSKKLINQIETLEKMPHFSNESEREQYMSCFFDFDAKLTIRSIGGLIKYFDRIDDENFEINFIKPLNLEKILLLDSNAFKSLQIFNPVDLNYAYRQTNLLNFNTFRTHLSSSRSLNSTNITLYGLYLSRMQTKIGISKLRSFLMKPIRDLNILRERHRVIEAFNDNQNAELTANIRNSLKKFKFINSILKRMKLTRINWIEWKRLFKTTKAILDIYNHCLTFNDILNRTIANKTSSQVDSLVIKTDKNIRNSTFISGVNQPFDIRSTPKSRPTQSCANSIIKTSLFKNDSSENLFTRIQACNYGSKFEYLLNLFENTVNIAESNQKNSCSILPRICSKLDEQKAIFAQLPEILTNIAREEIQKYKLDDCCCIYMPNHGFFLVFNMKNFLVTNNSFESSINTTTREQIDNVRNEFELRHDLKLVFKADDDLYYKNVRMFELDHKYGDIASVIKNLECAIIDQLQDEFMKYSHYYAYLIDLIGELDTLFAFAQIASEFDYVKPELWLSDDDCLEADSFVYAKQARHPLAEMFLDSSSFVYNDIISGDCLKLDSEIEKSQCNKIKIITSPNGKCLLI